MDVDGNCLVVSPCNSCRAAKSGVQACIMRMHNPRLTCVAKDGLAARHRQCVKPDQSITIFKLVDRAAGEESVEFAKQMIFQRPCDRCQHLKSCILGGHTLQDWTAFGEVEVNRPDKKRKSPTPTRGKSTRRTPPSTGKASRSRTPSGKAPAKSMPEPPEDEDDDDDDEAMEDDQDNGSANAEGEGDEDDEPGEAEAKQEDVKPKKRSKGAGGERDGLWVPTSISNPGSGGDPVAAITQAATLGGSAGILIQLKAISVAEDKLIEKYRAEIRRLDESEATKVADIKLLGKALESIRLSRKTMRNDVAEKRKGFAEERQRLTDLRLQELVREEEKLRQEKDAQWTACDSGGWDGSPEAKEGDDIPSVVRAALGLDVGNADDDVKMEIGDDSLGGTSSAELGGWVKPDDTGVSEGAGGGSAAGNLDTDPWPFLNDDVTVGGVDDAQGDGGQQETPAARSGLATPAAKAPAWKGDRKENGNIERSNGTSSGDRKSMDSQRTVSRSARAARARAKHAELTPAEELLVNGGVPSSHDKRPVADEGSSLEGNGIVGVQGTNLEDSAGDHNGFKDNSSDCHEARVEVEDESGVEGKGEMNNEEIDAGRVDDNLEGNGRMPGEKEEKALGQVGVVEHVEHVELPKQTRGDAMEIEHVGGDESVTVPPAMPAVASVAPDIGGAEYAQSNGVDGTGDEFNGFKSADSSAAEASFPETASSQGITFELTPPEPSATPVLEDVKVQLEVAVVDKANSGLSQDAAVAAAAAVNEGSNERDAEMVDVQR